jgi:hypothetical protein
METMSSLMSEHYGKIVYVENNKLSKIVMACACPFFPTFMPIMMRVIEAQLGEVCDETNEYLNQIFPDIKRTSIRNHSPMMPKAKK